MVSLKKVVFGARLVIMIICVGMILGSTAFAQKKSKPARPTDNSLHDFVHYLSKNSATKNDILAKFGDPTRKVKKLGGWEYWYYDRLAHKGQSVKLDAYNLFPFKGDRYVPWLEFKSDVNFNLRILFFPITLLLILPFTRISIIVLIVGSIIGVLKIKHISRWLFPYLIIGAVFALLGILY